MKRPFVGFLQTHPMLVRGLVLGYIVFAGCFVFPIRSEKFPPDFMKLYLLAASCGIIGLSLAGVYGPKKEGKIYIRVLLFTALGLLCRYLLEYGEISNTSNFTVGNVISYLVLIPIGTVIFYHFTAKSLITKSKSGSGSGQS